MSRDKISEEINQTKWLTETVISSNINQKWKSSEYQERGFYFGVDNNPDLSCYPQDTWVQEFLPYMYIGDVSAMRARYDLNRKTFRFDAIFDFSQTLVPQAKESERVISESERLANHFVIDLHDSINDSHSLFELVRTEALFEKMDSYVDACFSELRQFPRIKQMHTDNRRGVLINCAAGQSRSSAIAIMYMMNKYKISFIQAYHYLRTKRAIVAPNPGFVIGLLQYQKELGIVTPSLTEFSSEWIEDYRSSKAFSQLPFQVEDSKVIITVGDSNSNIKFLNLVSYLIVLGIDFTPEIKNNLGAIQLSAEDFARLQQNQQAVEEPMVLASTSTVSTVNAASSEVLSDAAVPTATAAFPSQELTEGNDAVPPSSAAFPSQELTEGNDAVPPSSAAFPSQELTQGNDAVPPSSAAFPSQELALGNTAVSPLPVALPPEELAEGNGAVPPSSAVFPSQALTQGNGAVPPSPAAFPSQALVQEDETEFVKAPHEAVLQQEMYIDNRPSSFVVGSAIAGAGIGGFGSVGILLALSLGAGLLPPVGITVLSIVSLVAIGYMSAVVMFGIFAGGATLAEKVICDNESIPYQHLKNE